MTNFNARFQILFDVHEKLLPELESIHDLLKKNKKEVSKIFKKTDGKHGFYCYGPFDFSHGDLSEKIQKWFEEQLLKYVGGGKFLSKNRSSDEEKKQKRILNDLELPSWIKERKEEEGKQRDCPICGGTGRVLSNGDIENAYPVLCRGCMGEGQINKS